VRAAIDQGGPAARRVKNWLNGVWLGHALHPAMTDLVIGAWWTGFVMDIVGARRSADAAMTLGVLAAVPTALSGAADWTDTEAEQRRTGLVHATLNAIGLVCTLLSLFARGPSSARWASACRPLVWRWRRSPPGWAASWFFARARASIATRGCPPSTSFAQWPAQTRSSRAS